MSARRISEKGALLPENPHFLEFERTDGDPTFWPANTTRVVDADGHVNFMQHIDIDSPLSVKWRVAVAQGVALGLELPRESYYELCSSPKL